MTSETTKRRSRLFSRLMVEECQTRDLREFYDPEYLTFLQAQRNTRNPWCPYSMACRILQQSTV